MRTTLDIDEDVLQAAKELAGREGRSLGKVLSELARRGLGNRQRAEARKRILRNGVPVFESRGEVVTLKKIQRLQG